MTTEILFHQTDIAWAIEQAVPITTALIAVGVAYLSFNHALRNVAKDHQHQFQIRTYEELLGPIREAIAASADYVALLNSFSSTVSQNYELQKQGKKPIVWHYRPDNFANNYQRCAQSMNNLIHAIESIRIVEPKLDIFIVSLGYIHRKVTEFSTPFFETTIRFSTKEMPFNGQMVQILPDPISEAEMNQIRHVSTHMSNLIIEATFYMQDLKIELQNLLLGEIYNKTKLKHRNAITRDQKIISLHDYDALMKHFKEISLK